MATSIMGSTVRQIPTREDIMIGFIPSQHNIKPQLLGISSERNSYFNLKHDWNLLDFCLDRSSVKKLQVSHQQNQNFELTGSKWLRCLAFPRVPCILMLKSCKLRTHADAARAWHSTKGKMQLMWSCDLHFQLEMIETKFVSGVPKSTSKLQTLSVLNVFFNGFTFKLVTCGDPIWGHLKERLSWMRVFFDLCTGSRGSIKCMKNLEFWKGAHMICDLTGENFNGKERANKEIIQNKDNWDWQETNIKSKGRVTYPQEKGRQECKTPKHSHWLQRSRVGW